MTNAGTLGKAFTRRLLIKLCKEVLERNGWEMTKPGGFGKARIYRITRDGETKLVAIRTTQDSWIAFPRTRDDKKWATLSDVDAAVVASVDPDDPRFARIHMIDANEMRRRFDRAYAARLDAGYTIPRGRGIWIALYENEASDPVTLVGAGAGIASPPLARVALDGAAAPAGGVPAAPAAGPPGASHTGGESLTIPEAKARLARALGVDPSSIRITVEA